MMNADNTYQPPLAEWPEEYKGQIPVNEMFYTLQGEGRWNGWPSIFVRLQFCNLGCAWCDTRYTWDQRSLDHGELYDPEVIADQVSKLIPLNFHRDSMPHIVLTGGEPMLHQDRLPELIDILRSSGFRFFQIETNGTLKPSPAMIESIDWWNCSPKLPNNSLPAEKRIHPDAIEAIAETDKADFKFVVRDEKDVETMLAEYGDFVPHNRIWLMPEGFTRQTQMNRMPKIAELCTRYGFKMSLRTHILTWDNERGR